MFGVVNWNRDDVEMLGFFYLTGGLISSSTSDSVSATVSNFNRHRADVSICCDAFQSNILLQILQKIMEVNSTIFESVFLGIKTMIHW